MALPLYEKFGRKLVMKMEIQLQEFGVTSYENYWLRREIGGI